MNTMNISEMNLFNSLPPKYTNHQSVFGKYAYSQALAQGGMLPESPFNPNSPYSTPHSFAPKAELMTPDTFQLGTVSPDELAAADYSPLFDELEDAQNWESLFLDETEEQQQDLRKQPTQQKDILSQLPKLPELPQISQETPQQVLPDIKNEVELFDGLDFSVLNEEVKSTCRRSPRASFVGGVTKKKVDDLGITVYKRKPRSLPLKPIEVDEDCGDVAVKRAKNTEAARRSRARKMERMSQLELRVRDLLDENERLKAEIKQLKG